MKILVLSEDIAGTGHTKAAQNVLQGIKTMFPHVTTKMEITLSKISPFLEKCVSKAYVQTIRHAPPLWGWAYKRDKEFSLVGKDLLRKFMAKKLLSFIENENPDLIVCTHAFCLGGLAELKRKGKGEFLLAAALTDYSVNPFWIYDEVDIYFVGATGIKQKMVKEHAVPEKRIYVTGIPIHPRFNLSLERHWIRQKLSIPNNAVLILVTGGGWGLAPFQEILSALRIVQHQLYVVVITGRNPRAKQEWAPLECPGHTLFLYDYIENMNEWMFAADLLIGKPGGLTVSEALACGLPLLIYKPIPGQEERNSEFLINNEAALRADSVDQLVSCVQKICEDAQLVHQLKSREAALAKPRATMEVSQILYELSKR